MLAGLCICKNLYALNHWTLFHFICFTRGRVMMLVWQGVSPTAVYSAFRLLTNSLWWHLSVGHQFKY